MKQTWKTLNKLLGRKKSKITQCPSLIIDGKLCTDSNLLANYFNDYFSSIGEKLVNKLATPQKQFSEFLGSPICNSMFLNPTSVTEIKKIISKVQPKNSTGIDEIPISVVKSSSDYILFGLCHIFNLSLSQGQFIMDFKKAKVIPVHRDVAAAPQTPQLGGPSPTLGAQVSLKLLFGYVTIFSSADLFTTDLNCRKKLACDIISECYVILSCRI